MLSGVYNLFCIQTMGHITQYINYSYTPSIKTVLVDNLGRFFLFHIS